jgi:uncharacterized paraquat-inducible protein A
MTKVIRICIAILVAAAIVSLVAYVLPIICWNCYL